MRIAVGSKNPLKLSSARNVLERVQPGAEFMAVGVDSGVSHTPLTNEETIAGARQRARVAREATGSDWGIGLEGGMTRVAGYWFTCVWCVIRDGGGETVGGGVHFQLPERVVRMILHDGKEMGPAMDALTGVAQSKRKMGAEGILTGGLIDREKTFENAVIYALAPRISEAYYRT